MMGWIYESIISGCITMFGLNRNQQKRALWIGVNLIALTPALKLLFDWWFYRLGAEPIRAVTLRTGFWGLTFLVASLAITPVIAATGWRWLNPTRKWLGLYSFFYILAHLLNFAGIDYGFDLPLVVEEIIFRRYALVGFAAFLILLSLAITSTKRAQKRLGKNWKKLHRWVYVAGILGAVHFIWLVKNAYTKPAIFAVLLALFLLARLKPIKLWLQAKQRGRANRGMVRAVGSTKTATE